ncbi:hypothetical protein FE257_001331 [Aspergillus nanangensis]|uniref:Xylanolytic transcriptional activator regulatory domain-containing protein n=1 Tax=Aspergillus nanangensis TaxID=2582783 RepID=A0AAD4CFF7_ASPNN|nr:hypothetical protein FE257_001331 [Aspergillus nanangensis]
MGFDCVYKKSERGVRKCTENNGETRPNEGPSQIEKRLAQLESILQGVTKQLQPTENPEDFLADCSSSQLPSPYQTPRKTTDTVDGMGAVIFADENGCGFFGESSNSGFIRHLNTAFKTYIQDKQHSSMRQTHVATDVSRPPTPCSIQDHSRTSHDAHIFDTHGLPSKTETIRLVNSFFQDFGMLFPYINRRAVLNDIEHAFRESCPVLRRSWLCMLQVILAFACDYSARHEVGDKNVSRADGFAQQALALAPDVVEQQPNVEMLQALLLLTQYLQGTRSSTLFSNYQRFTVQVAFQVGAHCPNQFPSETILECEVRRRCWHMVFILDKSMSLHFGRPSSVPSTYAEVPPPMAISLDEFDAAPGDRSPNNDVSTAIGFIHTIKLFHILADIVQEIYHGNMSPGKSEFPLELHQSIGSIEWKLHSWRKALPASIQIRAISSMDGSSSSPFDRLSIVLTLRYHFAKLLMHRATVAQFLDRTEKLSAGGIATDETLPPFFAKVEHASMEECVSAAVEIIDILHLLSASGHRMLMSWWFCVYYAFSAVLVIFVAYILRRQHEISFPLLDRQEGSNTFAKALDVISHYGPNTPITIRCHKYVQRLERLATTTGLFSGDASGLWDFNPSEGHDDLTLLLPELLPIEATDIESFMTFHDTEF